MRPDSLPRRRILVTPRAAIVSPPSASSWLANGRAGRARYTLWRRSIKEGRCLLGGGRKASAPREPSSEEQVRAASRTDRNGRRRPFVLRRTTGRRIRDRAAQGRFSAAKTRTALASRDAPSVIAVATSPRAVALPRLVCLRVRCGAQGFAGDPSSQTEDDRIAPRGAIRIWRPGSTRRASRHVARRKCPPTVVRLEQVRPTASSVSAIRSTTGGAMVEVPVAALPHRAGGSSVVPNVARPEPRSRHTREPRGSPPVCGALARLHLDRRLASAFWRQAECSNSRGAGA